MKLSIPQRAFFLFFSLCLFISLFSRHASGAVTFIQITDPHLFGSSTENERALKAFIADANTRSAAAPLDFIVVTGDIGIEDAVSIPNKDTKKRDLKPDPDTLLKNAAATFAGIIGESRVKRWFFVPGNNDLIDEDPASIHYYASFIAAVRQNLAGKIEVVDLTQGANAGVYPLGSFSFVGFNNASFKANNDPANSILWAPRQTAAIADLKKCIAGLDRVFIFYHIPEVDDPYLVRDAPDKTKSLDKDFPLSSWIVAEQVRSDWNNLIKEPAIKALFAGHFHDYRRDTYEDFHWLSSAPYTSASLVKLRVCPPLAEKRQEGKDPSAQARGYRIVTIDDGASVVSRIVWMTASSFENAPIAPPTTPPTLTVIDPAVAYPEINHHSITLLGSGFNRFIPSDNHIELEGQRELQVDWSDEPAAGGIHGAVVSDREIKLEGIDRAKLHLPVKIRVRVGDNTTAFLPVTFAAVDTNTPRIIALAWIVLTVLLVIGITQLRSSAQSDPNEKFGLITRIFLDPQTDTLSLSKFQFYLWTLAAIFGYVYLFLVRRFIQGNFDTVDIPPSLPGIILASASTTVIAQGITTAHGPKGAGAVEPALSDLITTGGVVAPERFQFLVWTIVGVVGFLATLIASDPATLSGLPNIPTQFLVLMGISSAGYLGGKIVRRPGPVIDAIVPTKEELQISGQNLSTDADILIDGTAIQFTVVSTPQKPEAEKSFLLVTAPEQAGGTLAKKITLTLATAKSSLLTGEHALRLTNCDGQFAEAKYPPPPLQSNPARAQPPVPEKQPG